MSILIWLGPPSLVQDHGQNPKLKFFQVQKKKVEKIFFCFSNVFKWIVWPFFCPDEKIFFSLLPPFKYHQQVAEIPNYLIRGNKRFQIFQKFWKKFAFKNLKSLNTPVGVLRDFSNLLVIFKGVEVKKIFFHQDKKKVKQSI